MNAPLVVVSRQGAVTTLRIDREPVHNALNSQVLHELDDALRVAAGDGTRAVVLTGTGTRSFSAGADLDELTGLSTERAHDLLVSGQAVLRRVEESPAPVIAAVNGLALGGGFELVLASSFAVLADHAELGLPETGLGLIPGYGGTQRLRRAVGGPVATYVVATGRRLDAARAHTLGLTPLPPVPVAEVVAAATEVAEGLAHRGPRAVRSALLALRRGGDLSLEAGLDLETSLAAIATASDEAAEGVAAFRERRRPDFDDALPTRGTP